MEHFYTLQGEGFHQGRAAYFVRLGGCDVGCVWCDVKESWNEEEHPQRSIEELVNEVKQSKTELVIITGGAEPEEGPNDFDIVDLGEKSKGE